MRDPRRPKRPPSGVDKTNEELKSLWTESSHAAWEMETNITDATEKKASAASEKVMAYTASAIRATPRFSEVKLPGDKARQLHLLKSGGSLPGPLDDKERAELAELSSKLSSMYGKGKVCNAEGNDCKSLGDLEDILRESRDEKALLEAWSGWRTISPEMRPLYERFVELGNTGAKDIGYDDLSVLWRSRYDMSPAEVDAEVERLWQQVKPLYDKLHCYSRSKLAAKYEGVQPEGAMPAHVFGNMWAQDWANIYDIVEPYPGKAELDVTKSLVAKNYTPKAVIELGEQFFTSLGLQELPDSFWERSMIEKPTDGREVVCHASAWDLTFAGDVRVKMCTKVNEEDLITAHHELGHIYYFLYYKHLPVLFQDGAHDGFHEAIGDAIALSVNPRTTKSAASSTKSPATRKGSSTCK